MDKALKQRLVGASVLIALAVVILPMLLGGQQGGQLETQTIEVPAKPSELSFETRRFPVGAQNGDKPSVIETTGPDVDRADPVIDSTPAKRTPENKQPAAVTVNPLPQPGTTQARSATPLVNEGPANTTPGRYLVQVASFSTTKNANNLAERLRLDNLPVLMDSIESAAGI